MSAWVSSLMIRFFAGGILCCLIMMLSGQGAQREIARLCCAAVMIIVTLAPTNLPNSFNFSLSGTHNAMEDTVADALSESKTIQKQQADENLTQLVESQAKALNIPCRAKIMSSLSEDGVYSVTQAYLYFDKSINKEKQNQAAASCAALCGIDFQNVLCEMEEIS